VSTGKAPAVDMDMLSIMFMIAIALKFPTVVTRIAY